MREGKVLGCTWLLQGANLHPSVQQAMLAAIGTLEGICCDQLRMGTDAAQQCHIAMKTQIVPQMRQVVAAKCPSNFSFDFVANGPVDVKFAIENRVLSVELIADDFKQCVRAKIMAAQGSCNGPT